MDGCEWQPTGEHHPNFLKEIILMASSFNLNLAKSTSALIGFFLVMWS